MRRLAELALISGGCSKLLGISDPVLSTSGVVEIAPTFSPVDGIIADVTGAELQVVDVDDDGRDGIVVPAGIVRQTGAGVFAPLAACPMRSSTLFRDLDGNGKRELLRIVNGMLEVRIQ